MTQAPATLLSMIGNTPLVELKGFETGPCRLFLKLESQNPGGSIKDRMALAMVEDAERSGLLRPGGSIVEATAGNTGLGLAVVAAVKGYRLTLVIPDKMSTEKIAHLHAFGVDIRITRSDVGPHHPEYYQNLAAQITQESPGTCYVNQFSNPANPRAHEETTAPEIWQQMDHQVDAVVCGVGSGGTMTGLSRYFSRVSPKVELILADPAGSTLAGYVNQGKPGPEGSYAVEGIGGSCVPAIADLSRVSHAITISDGQSFQTARDLLRRSAILGGSSSGTLVAAALEYCRKQTEPKRVVTFICDSGNKYLSKMYNDYWMIDQGYLERPRTGTILDLLNRRYQDGTVVSVGPADTLLTAFQRMRVWDVSQVPVIENGQVVGILDESDLLLGVHNEGAQFRQPVAGVMTRQLETISPQTSLDEVRSILDRGLVPLVMDRDSFLGLITRSDLLSHLRRKLK